MTRTSLVQHEFNDKGRLSRIVIEIDFWVKYETNCAVVAAT